MNLRALTCLDLLSAEALPVSALTNQPGQLGLTNAHVFYYEANHNYTPFERACSDAMLPYISFISAEGLPRDYLMDSVVLCDLWRSRANHGHDYTMEDLSVFLDDTSVRARMPILSENNGYGGTRSVELDRIRAVKQRRGELSRETTYTLAACDRLVEAPDPIINTGLFALGFDANGYEIVGEDGGIRLGGHFRWHQGNATPTTSCIVLEKSPYGVSLVRRTAASEVSSQ